MKHIKIIFSTLVGLWFFLVGCHSSQKVVSYTPDNIVPTDKSLLWRIGGKGLKQPSYLYGTIHMIPKSDLNITESTWNALNRCKKITFEIDMKEMTSLRTQFSMLTKAFMKNGKTLKDLLSPEDYTFVHEKMEDKGFSASMFERIKPMFLSMLLSNDEGGAVGKSDSKMTSVEMELWKVAKKQKTKSDGLESTAYQLSIFDTIPYESQAKMLVEALRTSSTDSDAELDKMIEMYKKQDIEAMQQMISAETDGVGEFEDVLLGNRNRNWIPLMGKMMKEQSTFFAVGAGHLGGKGGVIALLRAEGYVVEAVK
jgi:uncharacterized protein